MKVGFVGLGNQGAPIARRIAEAKLLNRAVAALVPAAQSMIDRLARAKRP